MSLVTAYAGTAGQMLAVNVVPVLTGDVMAPPGSATTVAVAEIQEWNFKNKVETGSLITFSNPADTQGNVWPFKMQGGVGSASVSIKGVVNASSAALFTLGAAVQVDLDLFKYASVGYQGIFAQIKSFNVGAKANNKDESTFDGEIEISGIPPAFGPFV